MNLNSNRIRNLTFLLALSGIGVLLLIFRNLYWGSTSGHYYVVTIAERPVKLTYAFLVWNLWLAWIPYLLSDWLKKVQLPAVIFFAIGLAWLFFLPNAPYLITDLIHLRSRPPVPMWYDAVLFMLFATTGLLLGLLSVARIEGLLSRRWGPQPALWTIVAIFFLCGIGIYLGRILRWNTWDLLTHPKSIAGDLLLMAVYPRQHLEAWGISMMFFVLMTVLYFGGKRVLVGLSQSIKEEP